LKKYWQDIESFGAPLLSNYLSRVRRATPVNVPPGIQIKLVPRDGIEPS
jgi:hypothetical protein